jgi:hypothetical protein
MTDLAFLYGADKRALFPEAVLTNAIIEKAPGQISKPLAILARPGLSAFATPGAGRIRGAAQAEGLFNSDAFVVVSTGLYRISALGVVTAISGTVAGDENVRIAIGQNADLISQLRIATGDAFYVYTEGDAAVTQDAAWTVAVGVAGAADVEYHRGDWLAIQPNTDKLYFLLPAATWEALAFASAEYAADRLVFIRARGDQVYLGGRTTTEIWTKTGQASPAYAPYGGLNFDYGARGRDAAVSMAGAMIWVDQDCAVRLSTGGDAEVISTNGLNEQIAKVAADDLTGWFFRLQQHFYFVLNLGGQATWVYDLAMQTWSRFETTGFPYWSAGRGVSIGDLALGFSLSGSTVWKIDADASDDDGLDFSWEFMARSENADGVAACDNVELEMLTGYGPREGYGSDPQIQMRFWDDYRGAWSRWRERPMGATGQTKTPRWNALGDFRRFRIFHWRVNAPVGRRVTAARLNVS